MRIGLDFDNTIVRYDDIFHKVALEQGVIDESVAVSKLAVRDHLRRIDAEDVWTEMQGYVYGARMSDAEPYPDVLAVLKWARDTGHDLFIISHKTRHPFMGPKYDLHASAREWIDEVLRDEAGPLVPPDNVFFREVKADKIDQIGRVSCDVFLDDLPEILTAENYPQTTQGYLFDPDNSHDDIDGVIRVCSWHAFKDHLGQR